MFHTTVGAIKFEPFKRGRVKTRFFNPTLPSSYTIKYLPTAILWVFVTPIAFLEARCPYWNAHMLWG
jgi:hypothetical protein